MATAPTTPREVFTWAPDASIEKDSVPTTFSARFGDGYEQRSGVGITPILPVWSLTFTGLRRDIDEIEAFLVRHKGWKSFAWKDPDEEEGFFVCNSWKKDRKRGVISSLKVEFRKVVD